MLKSMCVLFGIVFIAIGLLGFVPGAAPNGHLLGIFHVNAFHNLVHIVSGVIALMAGAYSAHAARLFFRVFGAIYGLVAILGFVYGDQPILGLLANNAADTWLHVGIAAVSLMLGFVIKESPDVTLRHKPA